VFNKYTCVLKGLIYFIVRKYVLKWVGLKKGEELIRFLNNKSSKAIFNDIFKHSTLPLVNNL